MEKKLKKGYVLINLPNHKYSKPDKNNWIFEHRAVVENYIKRCLKPRECIHHLNSRKKDNRISNLMIFKNHKKHAEWHNKLKRYGYLTNPMKREIAERWDKKPKSI